MASRFANASTLDHNRFSVYRLLKRRIDNNNNNTNNEMKRLNCVIYASVVNTTE